MKIVHHNNGDPRDNSLGNLSVRELKDKFDEMAEIAGTAAGLKPDQFPGLAHILRQTAAEERAACAKICDDEFAEITSEADVPEQHRNSWQQCCTWISMKIKERR